MDKMNYKIYTMKNVEKNVEDRVNQTEKKGTYIKEELRK